MLKVLRTSTTMGLSIRISSLYVHSLLLYYLVTYAPQDNIVIANSGDARICDFGGSRIAYASKSVAKPSTGIRGTPRYLAYELITLLDQHPRHTKESDVWAFGMTVFVSPICLCHTRHELTPPITGTYRSRTPIFAPWRRAGTKSYHGS